MELNLDTDEITKSLMIVDDARNSGPKGIAYLACNEYGKLKEASLPLSSGYCDLPILPVKEHQALLILII